MARKYVIRICGGDYRNLEPRSACLNALHDWPLPHGYVDASEVAGARIRYRWSNKKCPDCGLHGWAPGNQRPETNPVKITLETTS